MRYLIAFVLLVVLNGCSIMPEWLGASESKEKLEGERVSVLKIETQIHVDPSLEKVGVKVPKPHENARWYKSSGYHNLTYPNPTVAETLDDTIRISIGKGGERGQHLNATPIIARDKLFVLDGYGQVSAFDAHSIRKRLWKAKVKIGKDNGNFSNGGIAYYDGYIYVSSGSNHVVALNAETGDEIWRRTIQSIARSAPAVSNGNIYINTISNRLYALDAKNGGIIWTHSGVAEEISILGSAAPVVSQGVVLSPYSSGELFALYEADGSVKWFENLTAHIVNSTYSLTDIDASPVVARGRVFTVSNDGVLAANDIETGGRIWQQEIAGTQSPWVVGDFMYIITNKKELVSIHIATGGVKWIEQLPRFKDEEDQKGEIHWSGPVMASSQLYVVGSHGKMLVISPTSGNTVKTYNIPDKVFLPPVVAHNNLYLLNNDATLIMMSEERE